MHRGQISQGERGSRVAALDDRRDAVGGDPAAPDGGGHIRFGLMIAGQDFDRPVEHAVGELFGGEPRSDHDAGAGQVGERAVHIADHADADWQPRLASGNGRPCGGGDRCSQNAAARDRHHPTPPEEPRFRASEYAFGLPPSIHRPAWSSAAQLKDSARARRTAVPVRVHAPRSRNDSGLIFSYALPPRMRPRIGGVVSVMLTRRAACAR